MMSGGRGRGRGEKVISRPSAERFAVGRRQKANLTFSEKSDFFNKAVAEIGKVLPIPKPPKQIRIYWAPARQTILNWYVPRNHIIEWQYNSKVLVFLLRYFMMDSLAQSHIIELQYNSKVR
jgi:hypothetical protein